MRRLSIRGRLTLVYGSLFFVAGLVLLGVTYVLVSQRLPNAPMTSSQLDPGGPGSITPPPGFGGDLVRVAVRTRDEALLALITQGGIALLVVGAAAVALGWLIAGRVLQPLQRMTETARRIAATPAALHERIALVGPDDELKELADTFDLMIGRLDQSFEGQRTFIANASHELRTPLTVNRALLEVGLRLGTTTPELGNTLLEVNARHERLIEGLLLLARAEPEVREQSYVDLADVVEHIAAGASAGASVGAGGAVVAVVAVVAKTREAPTTGDPVLLERLVQNLVENGVRHNVPGGWVHVCTDRRPSGQARLVVTNTGPVVPRYEVPGLFEPFRRLERTTSPGAGLGLSIVQAVARAHGGEVHAEPREEGGLVVTVLLPPPRAAAAAPVGSAAAAAAYGRS